MANFTPGPWRWELNRTSKRIELCGGPRFDLSVVSFARYGMNNAAPVFWRWNERNLGTPLRADELAVEVKGREHHFNWFADVNDPNARLIAAAPALYSAVEALVECFIKRGPFDEPLGSSEQAPSINAGIAALSLALGEKQGG